MSGDKKTPGPAAAGSGTSFSPQDAMEFMQKMWNPLGVTMPGFGMPGMPGMGGMAAPAMPGAMPFPNPAAMFAARWRTRTGRDRPQDRGAAHHRELAFDERVDDADEHQDDGIAEGVARCHAWLDRRRPEMIDFINQSGADAWL